MDAVVVDSIIHNIQTEFVAFRLAGNPIISICFRPQSPSLDFRDGNDWMQLCARVGLSERPILPSKLAANFVVV